MARGPMSLRTASVAASGRRWWAEAFPRRTGACFRPCGARALDAAGATGSVPVGISPRESAGATGGTSAGPVDPDAKESAGATGAASAGTVGSGATSDRDGVTVLSAEGTWAAWPAGGAHDGGDDDPLRHDDAEEGGGLLANESVHSVSGLPGLPSTGGGMGPRHARRTHHLALLAAKLATHLRSQSTRASQLAVCGVCLSQQHACTLRAGRRTVGGRSENHRRMVGGQRAQQQVAKQLVGGRSEDKARSSRWRNSCLDAPRTCFWHTWGIRTFFVARVRFFKYLSFQVRKTKST